MTFEGKIVYHRTRLNLNRNEGRSINVNNISSEKTLVGVILCKEKHIVNTHHHEEINISGAVPAQGGLSKVLLQLLIFILYHYKLMRKTILYSKTEHVFFG